MLTFGPHFQHVAPQRGVALATPAPAASARCARRTASTRRSASVETKNDRARPAVLPRNDQAHADAWRCSGAICFASSAKTIVAVDAKRLIRGAQNRSAEFRFAHRADDDEIVVCSARRMPDAAGSNRDFRDVPLRLPARRKGAREFRIVRNDQDARGEATYSRLLCAA